MARPSKFTPEIVEKLATAIRLGATYDLAAAYAGITYETFNEWRKHKPGFSDQLRQAEGVGLMGWLVKIEQAASSGAWQAAAWKAERRYPQQYGRTVQEVQGKDGGPIEVADVSDARSRLAGRLDELAARRAARSVDQQSHRTGS